ncbi:hypothetical protein [Clostridium botulinum]|uniref:hypothetical protein n=1 Tax=Clostridium botulinum TaxID=1491 RepID=UPI0019673A32|nr:hypothetical protein [Clostridium botulinum]MBN1079350.1 hypothetical protein [Clostridium botulinum]
MEDGCSKKSVIIEMIRKLKDNKKKILVIIICFIISGIAFYKFGYLDKGIGMSVSGKQKEIDKLIEKQNYDEANNLANVYMEKETQENQDAIKRGLKYVERLTQRMLMKQWNIIRRLQ